MFCCILRCLPAPRVGKNRFRCVTALPNARQESNKFRLLLTRSSINSFKLVKSPQNVHQSNLMRSGNCSSLFIVPRIPSFVLNWRNCDFCTQEDRHGCRRNAGSFPEQRPTLREGMTVFGSMQNYTLGPGEVGFRPKLTVIKQAKITTTLALVSLFGYKMVYRQLGLRILLTICRLMFNSCL